MNETKEARLRRPGSVSRFAEKESDSHADMDLTHVVPESVRTVPELDLLAVQVDSFERF